MSDPLSQMQDQLERVNEDNAHLRSRNEELEAALHEAWGVIANAGDWIPKEPGTPCERSRADWQEAAERWRDERFHPLIRATSPPNSEPAEEASGHDSPSPKHAPTGPTDTWRRRRD